MSPATRIQLGLLLIALTAAPGCDDLSYFWAQGIQQELDPAELYGWTECFRGTYDETGAPVAEILANCPGDALLLACKPTASNLLTLAAMAPRDDVLSDCDGSATCTTASNGVGWYFYPGSSWGFAPEGAVVNLDSCDYDGTEEPPGAPAVIEEPLGGGGGGGADPLPNPELRMCWHLDSEDDEDLLDNGYRCGHNDLNSAADWERLIYTNGTLPE